MKNTALLWFGAFLAGILGAAATISFHALITATEWLLTHHTGSFVQDSMSLPAWERILVPTTGGLLAGLVIHFSRRWTASGHHIDYIDAARKGDIVLNDRTNASRMLSSLLSVGSGASIGREGPMVQFSAWLASWLARILPIPKDQRNAILICGIAAGISAAYHAPIAGVVFILELALGFFARNTIAPVLISAVTSSAIIFWMVEPKPLYIMPPLPLEPVTPMGLLVALAAGVVSGLIGLWLLKFIELGRTGFGYIGEVWLRFSIGGLIVGLLSVYVPEVWGNGYSVVSKVLDGGLAWKWVAIVLIAKFIATVASSSSGAIGGIFTPTLFMGATSGYLLGWSLEHWLGAIAGGDPVTMAIICMAAVLSAVTHAPLMAIVMVLEMTDQVHLVLPVMLACGAAYAVSTHFGVKPLYGNPIEHHA